MLTAALYLYFVLPRGGGEVEFIGGQRIRDDVHRLSVDVFRLMTRRRLLARQTTGTFVLSSVDEIRPDEAAASAAAVDQWSASRRDRAGRDRAAPPSSPRLRPASPRASPTRRPMSTWSSPIARRAMRDLHVYLGLGGGGVLAMLMV